MNSKITSNETFEKKKNSRLKNRRAVTEIISTMMLMGVTVTGASTLTYFMNDAFLEGNLGTVSTLDSSSLNLLLLAYDTRDSTSLLTLLDVDNKISGELCGASCFAAPTNSLPKNLGTEFIVLQIKNNAIDSIYLHDFAINNVNHEWDPGTATIQLNALNDYLPATNRPYPADGTFSLLPVGNSPIIQSDSNEIQSGDTVNVLVKLSTADSDILLNKGMNISLNVGAAQAVNFFIESGDAR